MISDMIRTFRRRLAPAGMRGVCRFVRAAGCSPMDRLSQSLRVPGKVDDPRVHKLFFEKCREIVQSMNPES